MMNWRTSMRTRLHGIKAAQSPDDARRLAHSSIQSDWFDDEAPPTEAQVLELAMEEFPQLSHQLQQAVLVGDDDNAVSEEFVASIAQIIYGPPSNNKKRDHSEEEEEQQTLPEFVASASQLSGSQIARTVRAYVRTNMASIIVDVMTHLGAAAILLLTGLGAVTTPEQAQQVSHGE